MTHPDPEQSPSGPEPSWPPAAGYPPPPSWPPPGGYPPGYPPPHAPYGPAPQPVYSVPSPVPEPPATSAGHASMAFGVVAFVLGWIPFVGVVGLACGVAGLMFGLRAQRLAGLGYVTDRGLTIAGVALSCIGLVAGVVINGVVLVFALA